MVPFGHGCTVYGAYTLDLSAIDRSSAYPWWKTLVGWMAKQVFLAPDPVVKNSAGNPYLPLGLRHHHSAARLCLRRRGDIRSLRLCHRARSATRYSDGPAQRGPVMTAITQPGRHRNRERILRRLLWWIAALFLAGGCFLWIYPFLWMLSASLKTSFDVFKQGLDIVPKSPVWSNYDRAWNAAHFGQYLRNTVIVTVATVILVVIRSAMAAYVLAAIASAAEKSSSASWSQHCSYRPDTPSSRWSTSRSGCTC